MRIAMLAPISWPLPPTGYGPWEQVASDLVEGLVARGHDVTVFAAEGSKTSAKHVATVPYSFNTWPISERERPREQDPETGLLEGPPDPRVLENYHIAQVMERAASGEFDIVHSHLHVHALTYGRLIPCPLVTTLHGSAWVKATHPVLSAYRDFPFVSLSDAERSMLPELNYVATVHNGIRVEEFPFQEEKEDFLLFAGRLAPEKGPADAVQVALGAGKRIVLAGMIEPQHEGYFRERIEPYLEPGRVEYVGEKSRVEVAELYRRASALVLMTAWCEPFGLVAVEAQASGTPLIALRRGALPEIIVEGETGFVVDDVDGAISAASRVHELSPRDCRRNAEERFSTSVMAEGYEKAYEVAHKGARVPA